MPLLSYQQLPHRNTPPPIAALTNAVRETRVQPPASTLFDLMLTKHSFHGVLWVRSRLLCLLSSAVHRESHQQVAQESLGQQTFADPYYQYDMRCRRKLVTYWHAGWVRTWRVM